METWLFTGICASFARMEEQDRELLQDLCYSEEGRKNIAWELAGMFLSIGVRPPGLWEPQPRRIHQLITRELLAGCLLQLIEEHPTPEQLQEWTVGQQGWYGTPKNQQEEKHAHQRNRATLPDLPARHSRPSRIYRSYRPGRSPHGASDEIWPL